MGKKLYVLAALVMAVAITLSSVGGTYAKYTSRGKSTDTATVAKWDIDFLTNGTEVSNSHDFDLFGDSAVIAPGMSGKVDLKITNGSDVPAKIEYMKLDYAWSNNTVNGTPITPALTFCVTDPNAAGPYAANKVDCTTDKTNFKSLADVNTMLSSVVSNNRFNKGASQTLELYWYWQGATDTLPANPTDAQVAAYITAHKADTDLGEYAAAQAAAGKDLPTVTATMDVVVSQITD